MAHPHADDEHANTIDPDALPFVAPCRRLQTSDPVSWLKLGWQDFKRSPCASLCYGGFLVVLSYILAYFTWKLGGYILSLTDRLVVLAGVCINSGRYLSCRSGYRQ